jgi:hypothetical protein
MDKFQEQIFEMIGRCRNVGKGTSSRAAAVIGQECQMLLANDPNRNKSKAASVTGFNKVKVIADFLSSNGARFQIGY